jgi:hypothetical protein
MVYEGIDITTRHITMRDPTIPDAEITLIAKSLPVGILSTCWTVLAECYKFMCPKLEGLGKERVRFVVDIRSFDTFRDPGLDRPEQLPNFYPRDGCAVRRESASLCLPPVPASLLHGSE